MVFHHFTSMVGVIEEQTTRDKDVDGRHSHLKAEKKFLSNLDKHINKNMEEDTINPTEKIENLNRITGFGIGVGSLYLQEALGYPFLVLQRQCQVNNASLKYHVQPFSLFPVINKMHQRQNIGAFWKGWGSSGLVKGLTIGTEIVIFELCNVPREEMKQENDKKGMIIHETLKGASLLMTLPFFSASLIDTVQTLVLGEPRSILTFFKDAFYRLIGWYTSRGHGRLISFYSLVLPSILYGVLRYSVKVFLSSYILAIRSPTKVETNNEQESTASMRALYYAELSSNFMASLLTDVMLFPLETVFLRLHLQGTRTIIDDTDKGYGVVPLCTSYDGVTDCFNTIQRQEGFSGFYKGFGALCLQYFVQFIILKGAKIFYSGV